MKISARILESFAAQVQKRSTGFKMVSLLDLYSLYFKLFRRLGVFPFNFDPDTMTVWRVKTPGQRAQTGFNWVFLCSVCLSEAYLLAYAQYTEHRYATMKNGHLIQGLWFTGAVVALTIFSTILFYAGDIAKILTTSLRLEQFVFTEMTPGDEVPKKKARIHLFKLQLMLCGSAVVFTPLVLIPISLFFPRFPPFLNSLFLKSKAYSPTELDKYLEDSHPILLQILNHVIRWVFHGREVYFGLMAWAIFGSFDMFLNATFSIIARTIDYTQNVLAAEDGSGTSLKRQNGCLNLYSGVRVHLTSIESTLGALIFLMELLNLVLNALVIYAALMSSNLMLFVFFTFNSFTVTLRMYVFYLPIASVYVKSSIFMKAVSKYVRRDRDGAVVANKGLAMKLKTLRQIVCKPMGLHRIMPSSIMDYILAVLSYMVVAIKT